MQGWRVYQPQSGFCLIATFSVGLYHLSAGLEAIQYRVALNERETYIMVEHYLLVWFEYTMQRVIAHSRINEIVTLWFPGGILSRQAEKAF